MFNINFISQFFICLLVLNILNHIFRWFLRSKFALKNHHILIKNDIDGSGIGLAVDCISFGANVSIIDYSGETRKKNLEKRKINENQVVKCYGAHETMNDELTMAINTLEKEFGSDFMYINCKQGYLFSWAAFLFKTMDFLSCAYFLQFIIGYVPVSCRKHHQELNTYDSQLSSDEELENAESTTNARKGTPALFKFKLNGSLKEIFNVITPEANKAKSASNLNETPISAQNESSVNDEVSQLASDQIKLNLSETVENTKQETPALFSRKLNGSLEDIFNISPISAKVKATANSHESQQNKIDLNFQPPSDLFIFGSSENGNDINSALAASSPSELNDLDSCKADLGTSFDSIANLSLNEDIKSFEKSQTERDATKSRIENSSIESQIDDTSVGEDFLVKSQTELNHLSAETQAEDDPSNKLQLSTSEPKELNKITATDTPTFNGLSSKFSSNKFSDLANQNLFVDSNQNTKGFNFTIKTQSSIPKWKPITDNKNSSNDATTEDKFEFNIGNVDFTAGARRRPSMRIPRKI